MILCTYVATVSTTDIDENDAGLVEYKRTKEPLINDISAAMGCNTPIEAIGVFEQMILDMDLKNPVAGLREEELEILSTSVNPVRLKNNPVELKKEVIRQLYSIIVESKRNERAVCQSRTETCA